jgi:hypothetical protein
MSVDYLLFHRGRLQPRWWARMRAVYSGGFEALGTPQELMQRLDRLFPQLRWEQSPARRQALRVAAAAGVIAPDAPSWFGRGGPEFLISPDAQGQVRTFSASRIEPAELRRVEKELRLVSMCLAADGLWQMFFRG